MATDTIPFPTPRAIREMFATAKFASPGHVASLNIEGDPLNDPLQIRMYLAKPPQVRDHMVRVVVLDGGSSYLSQYGGHFQSVEAMELFVQAVVRDIKRERAR